MSIFTSRDPAGQTVMELGLITAAIASTHQRAMEAGRRAAERRREKQAAYQHDCELAEALGRADELGRLALRAVHHVASLEAEVRRLRVSLDQRQAFIDRLRNGDSA